LILKTLDAVRREPSSPATDAIGRHVDSLGDLAVGAPVGGQQHDLGAHDNAVGQRQAARAALKLKTALAIEFDRRGHASHAITFVNQTAAPSTRRNFRPTALRRRGDALGSGLGLKLHAGGRPRRNLGPFVV
jgi:hypothetical protein